MIKMSRRELAGSLLMAGSLSGAESRASYVVVGAGVFGAWTAYYLRQAGHKVTLLDQYGPASGRASSGGESRIIRCAYGPDLVYTRMAHRSLPLWSDLFQRSGRPLLLRIGVLWMAKAGNQYTGQSRESLRQDNVPFEDLSTAELRRRYPQIRVDDGTEAILEPESGALLARQAVAVVVEQFVKAGGVYRHSLVVRPTGADKLKAVTTTDGETISADGFVFACGPWFPKVFPELLGPRIFPTRQEVLFFGPPAGDRRFEPPQMPVWIDFIDDRGMYGFPDLERRGFKVAFDNHGPEFDPDTGSRTISADKIEEARAYLKDRFPAMGDAPVLESRVCQYENTSNGDFVIDRHPDMENVWIVGGGSGHGFKHGPAVGEYAAARVLGKTAPAIEPRFSLASKGTKQNRAVH
jgi:sarcosine oxidase